ncbi:hypothetical protein GA0070606_0437 [Micromonospora citrea]|uniref:Uncharacterized protein n=1 Tax=Micromonospora citrea TaxID=47855 RepID=A0A1C6TSI6_9ACTN|nr:hypothetical protein [Micromonospora citrea]SCL44762.1 hypothetical protein GA0070606_0437 [Micromonospora citrea]
MHGQEGRDAEAVRVLLSEIAPPSSRVTVAGLLAEGRRARRRRRSAAAVTGVLVLSFAAVGGVSAFDRSSDDGGGQVLSSGAAGTADPSTPCTVTELELPAKATTGEVNAGSPSGRFLAGFSSVGNALATPVRWDGTRAEPIKVNGPAEAKDVNDSGVTVGSGQGANGRSVAWAFVDGTVITLPIPKGYTGAEANAINAHGDVAGVLFAGDRMAAAVWRGTSANARVDILPAASGATAFGISDSGVVVGSLDDGKDSFAHLWNAQGQGSRLTAPAGFGGSGLLGVRGEWAYGVLSRPDERSGSVPSSTTQRAGDATSPSPELPTAVNPNVSVVWDLRNGQASIVSDGAVKAVNPGGETVVNHEDRTASLRSPDGALRKLPSLPDQDNAHATALSDAGTQAAGTSGQKPVRWQCMKGGK